MSRPVIFYKLTDVSELTYRPDDGCNSNTSETSVVSKRLHGLTAQKAGKYVIKALHITCYVLLKFLLLI